MAMTQTIEWAAREKRRSVNAAVGKNFFKTITEPITNSDSASKKKEGVPHASGLIDLILGLPENHILDTAQLRASILKQKRTRRIEIHLATAGAKARQCRVVDYGPGMTQKELTEKFTTYAAAKAKGENTRSLFGRGALDVLLYHENAEILTVSVGILSRCRIFWDANKDPKATVDSLGAATAVTLKKNGLPDSMADGGTEIRFKLKEGTPIPSEDQFVSKLSSFYMLRLISADPNCEVTVHRYRTAGQLTDTLAYDFPIGDILMQRKDTLVLNGTTKLPIGIMVARSHQDLVADSNLERRESGLLFVDENDAVMDLTLLPEWDKSPYLSQIFGVVRVTGLRGVLESYLEDDEPVAVLTETRDGFNLKHEVTKKLFELVEKHVKPIYEREIQRRKKGDGKRSEKLAKKIRTALKALNHFNSEETEDNGSGAKKRTPKGDPIFFSHDTLTLHTGIPRHITLSVDLSKVEKGEIVLFETDNAHLTLNPDAQAVRAREGQTHDHIEVVIQSGTKNTTATITAFTIDKNGQELRATAKVIDVIDPPIPQPPADIAFSAYVYSGQPNRENNAFLLVNMKAFTGMPEIAFSIEKRVGSVYFDDQQTERMKIKVTKDMIVDDVARIPIAFFGTGWGQHAEVIAKAKSAQGHTCYAKTKLRFERIGSDKFSNFHYEDLGRPVLGDVAGDKLYINAGYALHQEIFGPNEDTFNEALETDSVAQVRAAAVLVEAAVYYTATKKYVDGGRKGLSIDSDDPIGSMRKYLEESRMKLEPQIIRALSSPRLAPVSENVA